MPNNKLTDNEIIKALMICSTKGASCKDCPAFVKVDRSKCKQVLKGAIEIINCLQADNKEIKYKVKKWKENYEYSQVVVGDFREIINKQAKELKTAKAEAYKECIEKVMETALVIKENAFQGCYVISKGNLDNLLKKLVGEDNA